MLKRYYLVEWPESKKFIGHIDCVETNNKACFVPCKLYYDKIGEKEDE